MSSDPPAALYPVAVVQDRYSGTYSGGTWWAIAQANIRLEGMMRIDWLLEHGPGGDDATCATFWNSPPPWIAIGPSPDAAVALLVRQLGADTDDWEPPL